MIIREYSPDTINELTTHLTDLKLVEWGDGTMRQLTTDNRYLIALFTSGVLAHKDAEIDFDRIMDFFVNKEKTLMQFPWDVADELQQNESLEANYEFDQFARRLISMWIRKLGITGRGDIPEFVQESTRYYAPFSLVDSDTPISIDTAYVRGFVWGLAMSLKELAVLEVQAREEALRPNIHRILRTGIGAY